MALGVIEPELLPIEVLHCGHMRFPHHCSSDLDLDSMTFIYELGPYPIPLVMYRMSKNDLSKPRLSTVIESHTDRQTSHTPPKILPLSLAGGN